MARVTATDPPAGYIVLETFVVVEGGVPILYAKDKTVEPGHPAIKKHPDKFGPIVFNYRTPARLRAPEVRAD